MAGSLLLMPVGIFSVLGLVSSALYGVHYIATSAVLDLIINAGWKGRRIGLP